MAKKPKRAETPKAKGEASPSKSDAPKAKKARKALRRYSDAERQRILETARREGLSGPKAAKRFGISTLTFYNWRKKAGTRSRGRTVSRAAASNGDFGNLSGQLREVVRARLREMLPEILAEEVAASLGARPRRGR